MTALDWDEKRGETLQASAPDIVYILRPGDDNEELRYSLRSLENLPHGRVWAVGDGPSWLRNVELLRLPLLRDKQLTAERNLWTACSHPEISDPFVVMNDDFFVMQPMSELLPMHLGDLRSVIDQHRSGTAYRRAMEKTYERLLELGTIAPMSYEAHIPMLIEKTGMLLALSLGKGIHGVHNRTLYGNLMEVGGTEISDVKVYMSSRDPIYRDRELLSTSDRVFRTHPVGRYIRNRFPLASTYERIHKGRTAVRYSSVVVRP